jgi:hypothetical protein
MKIRSTSTVLMCTKIRSTSNNSLLATSHFKNTYTMSDYEYNYDEYNYDEDEDLDDEDDDDGLRINGRHVEDLEDIKDYERGIMDDDVVPLGGTVF